MRILIAVAVIMVLSVAGATAAQDRQAARMRDNQMMGLMNHEQMATMRGHIEAMQETMQSVRREEDPERRQQLLQEHMVSMNAAMAEMGGSMLGATRQERLQDMSTEERLELMQNQVGMMQQMMEQMMHHYAEAWEGDE